MKRIPTFVTQEMSVMERLLTKTSKKEELLRKNQLASVSVFL